MNPIQQLIQALMQPTSAPSVSQFVLPGTVPGLVSPGNIDLLHRPSIHNPDGSTSSVRSITVTDDQGRAILLPSAIGTARTGGRVVSNQDAIRHYQQTGRNLGVFANEQAADAYAQLLHQQQARGLSPMGPPAP